MTYNQKIHVAKRRWLKMRATMHRFVKREEGAFKRWMDLVSEKERVQAANKDTYSKE